VNLPPGPGRNAGRPGSRPINPWPTRLVRGPARLTSGITEQAPDQPGAEELVLDPIRRFGLQILGRLHLAVASRRLWRLTATISTLVTPGPAQTSARPTGPRYSCCRRSAPRTWLVPSRKDVADERLDQVFNPQSAGGGRLPRPGPRFRYRRPVPDSSGFPGFSPGERLSSSSTTSP